MASFSEAPPGNPAAGEKTKCAQCHTVDKGAGHKHDFFDEDGSLSESGSELRDSEQSEPDEDSSVSNDDVDVDNGEGYNDDDQDDTDDSREVVEESDSSEDEAPPRNTIGDDVPLIWRKIFDDLNDEEIELTKEEIKIISRLAKGKAPHAEFDPFADYIDYFIWDGAKHPLSNAPEPKRRFTPSKHESKKVVQYVRAIRKGLIKLDEKPKEEPRFYQLWGDDSSAPERQGLTYIPPPKTKLPGHDESYNPSPEYIPTQEEINSYQLMFEEDRPKFIPKRFTSLRSVPAYEKAVNETFDRCLDLYLCPRARKKRINIDPESLKPKLPSHKDLRPYPTTCYLEYRGHNGPVLSISTDSTGQWIASGSKLPVLAVASGANVYILNTRLGNGEEQKVIEDLLHVRTLPEPDDSGNNIASILSWEPDVKHSGVRLKHFKTVASVEWHRKGDYLASLMPAGESRAVLIHQLSKKKTQRIPFKLHGLAVSTAFHPTRSVFFVSTKKNVLVYDLLKQKLVKKLETGVREISSISIHPGGDNIIVGSKDGKICWFDMDLSSRPYRVLDCHPKDVTKVAFHRSYPLFASASEDCTAYVFHGMVYSDLNQNPLIVPLVILRGHDGSNGKGVMDCKFHPRQPWLFTAGGRQKFLENEVHYSSKTLLRQQACSVLLSSHARLRGN
ncbi:hypothetical protein Leryth_007236 [Lithospermum erythrorhizon]|nr:hypothetical protein Leryth_007236 [Lithospermum erythrorhizon]